MSSRDRRASRNESEEDGESQGSTHATGQNDRAERARRPLELTESPHVGCVQPRSNPRCKLRLFHLALITPVSIPEREVVGLSNALRFPVDAWSGCSSKRCRVETSRFP